MKSFKNVIINPHDVADQAAIDFAISAPPGTPFLYEIEGAELSLSNLEGNKISIIDAEDSAPIIAEINKGVFYTVCKSDHRKQMKSQRIWILTFLYEHHTICVDFEPVKPLKKKTDATVKDKIYQH